MRRPPVFFLVICLWLLLELLAFSLVVHFAGFSGAIILGLVTSLAGVTILRNVGKGAARRLRDMMEGKELPNGKMLDGMLSAMGAVLLIIPGFISDLAGLALAAPSLRQFIARRFTGPTPGRARTNAEFIDLAPGDWQRTADPAAGKLADKRAKKPGKLADGIADSL